MRRDRAGHVRVLLAALRAEPEPLSLIGAFEATRRTVSICSRSATTPPLEHMSERALADAASAARDLGLTIELGTKGNRARPPAALPRAGASVRRRARAFDALRRRLPPHPPRSRGAPARRAARVRDSRVTLALETYEQVATADLTALVDRAGSPHLGICLDPANVLARLELPRDCVAQTAAHVKNVHVKDFAFARQDGWVGFTYSGAPMGAGLHDYPHLLETVRPRARDQRDRRALAALAGRRRDHRPHRAGLDPHHHRIPEEHSVSTTTDTYKIAVVGAGGKMACASRTIS